VGLQRHEVVPEHQVRRYGAKEFRIDALFAQIDKGVPVAFRQLARYVALLLLIGRGRDARYYVGMFSVAMNP